MIIEVCYGNHSSYLLFRRRKYRRKICGGNGFLRHCCKNQKALNIHHESPMMQTITELREKYDLHMEVECCLSDDEIPENDRKYIKK